MSPTSRPVKANCSSLVSVTSTDLQSGSPDAAQRDRQQRADVRCLECPDDGHGRSALWLQLRRHRLTGSDLCVGERAGLADGRPATGVVSGAPPNGVRNFNYSVTATNMADTDTAGPFKVVTTTPPPLKADLMISICGR